MKKNFLDFREYAENKLSLIKESKLTQYERYVSDHFGRLTEDMDNDAILKLAMRHCLKAGEVIIGRKVIYNDQEFAFFVHDENQYIALNSDLIVVDTGDFNSSLLSEEKIITEDAIDDEKERIYSKREAMYTNALKYKQSDPEKYSSLEKSANDWFTRAIVDLRLKAKKSS